MKNVINFENIHNFAYVSDRVCNKPIKGIIIEFSGLGDTRTFNEERSDAIDHGKHGLLFVVPYLNPWSWMNKQSIACTDEIIDIIFEHLNLPENTPIVAIGGSMGGQSALVYSRYAKRTPIACIANCPVCDLVHHYNERTDTPRTLYSSFYHETCSMEEALKKASPIHLASEMPHIPYHIFHCDEDKSVNISHSQRFVPVMKELGYDITLDIAHGKGHCELTPEMWKKFGEYMYKAFGIEK